MRRAIKIEVPVVTLAALLLRRHEPMAPHHVGALREALGDRTDEELNKIILTGMMEVPS